MTFKSGKPMKIRGVPIRYEFFIAMMLLFIFCGFSDAKSDLKRVCPNVGKAHIFIPGPIFFISRFMFILPIPPLIPLMAFCMA